MPKYRLQNGRLQRTLNITQLEDRTTPTLCCGDFLTYTQGGWGSKPAGNNPGSYLHANFAGAFSNGVQIGDQSAGAATNDNTIGHWAALFTTAQAITNWLPQGSTAGALNSDLVNPTSDGSVLAGQTLALTLNLGFDDDDPAFSPSTSDMGSLLVTSGPFAGKTADFVLATCNAILAGITTTGYTAAQANDAATAINENFDNGSVNGGTDNGFLDCSDDDCDETLFATMTIEGQKFEDLNGDGDDENGADPGYAGWQIDVIIGLRSFTISSGYAYTYDHATGSLITGAPVPNGGFNITVNNIDVMDGPVAYTIQEQTVFGWTQTYSGPVGGYVGDVPQSTSPFAVSDVIFGNFENIDIRGVKYTDMNGDGSIAGDPAGTPGQTFTINLYKWTDADFDNEVDETELSAVIDTTETDANTGAYAFDDLGPLAAGEQYFVREAGEGGWTQTFGTAGYSTVATSGDDDTDNHFGNFENVDIRGVKFYDTNTDGVRDADGADNTPGTSDDEPTIAGWQVGLDTTGDGVADVFTLTNEFGEYSFTDLGPGQYAVIEGTQPNWVATTATSFTVTVGGSGVQSGGESAGNDFGNVKLGATGGKTLGFWSNKNGESIFKGTDGGASALAGLQAQNLRNANGNQFDPADYKAFRTWLLNATATNMSYMLSAQYAAAWLNVNKLGVDDDTMIHVGTLSLWAGNVQGAALVTNLGTLVSPTGFVRLGDVMAAANTLLGTNGSILAGDPLRPYAEAVKVVLDGFNNNLSISVAGLTGWNDDGDGIMESGEFGTWAW